MSARWMLTSAMILGLSMGSTQVYAHPGARLGEDRFRLTFDELGNGFIQTIQNGSLGPAVVNNGTVGADGFLRFALPEPVILGDVAIAAENEPCTSASDCSDGLRFIQEGDNFFMQYFSSPGEPEVPADTGFPADFSFSLVGATETGTEDILQTFLYTPPERPDNEYFGVSDGQLSVPEPATITLLGTALLGLGAALRRQRRSGR